jgi:hypothetical protein
MRSNYLSARRQDEGQNQQIIGGEDHDAGRTGVIFEVIMTSFVVYTLTVTSVISVAISQLLRDLEQSTDPFFNTMSRTPWASIETVTGQMPYVIELTRVVDAFVEVIKTSIEQKKYLRNFYDRTSRYFS